MNTRVRGGVHYMLAAAFFFSLMSLLVKLAGQRLPSSEIVFARSLVSLVIGYAMLRRAGLSAWGTNKRILVLRGAAGFIALTCFFFAVTRLPLADATVIHFTNPVFTGMLASVFLHEGMRRGEIAGLVVSLAGVVLVATLALVAWSLVSRNSGGEVDALELDLDVPVSGSVANSASLAAYLA